MKRTDEFWLTNISERNVMISDLNITIKARSTVNLLDKRRYSFTQEQLEKSLENGSLKAKSHLVVKRLVPPGTPMEYKIQVDKSAVVPDKMRSVVEIKEENYEELQLTDEQFAEEMADTVDIDRKPLISKD